VNSVRSEVSFFKIGIIHCNSYLKGEEAEIKMDLKETG
jgi:hypothetical protein